MSLAGWIEEFYPVSAVGAAKKGVGAAIEQSLQKWRGTTKENLKKHGVEVSGRLCYVIDSSSSMLCLDRYSCALCVLFYDNNCTGCPLVKDDGSACFSPGRGYYMFADLESGPDLMIQELEAALDKWKKENKNA